MIVTNVLLGTTVALAVVFLAIASYEIRRGATRATERVLLVILFAGWTGVISSALAFVLRI